MPRRQYGANDPTTGHIIKGGSRFGSVWTVMEVGICGHEAVLQIKMGTGLYPKTFIADALKTAPGSVSIHLKAVAPKEVPLVATGYRYSTKTTLFFTTEKAGTTHLGKPYVMKYTDDFGNLCTPDVEHPNVLSQYFLASNAIDHHNQSWQYDSGLERSWVTQDCYFRLACTHRYQCGQLLEIG